MLVFDVDFNVTPVFRCHRALILKIYMWQTFIALLEITLIVRQVNLVGRYRSYYKGKKLK